MPWSMPIDPLVAFTGMARLGYGMEVAAALSNPSPGSVGGITAIYSRHRYEREKREALQAWADQMNRLIRIEGSKN